MNIQSTKRPPQGISNIQKKEAAPAAKEPENNSAQNDNFAPAAEGESRVSAAWRGGIRSGVKFGETVGTNFLGPTAAFGLAIGSAAALSLGGALVGGAIGGSFGTALSALQSNGIGEFFLNSFSNLGQAVSIGSKVGVAAGAVGGLALGYKVGGNIGKAAAFPIGFLYGAGKGFVKPGSVPPPVEQQEPKEPKFKTELHGLFKTTGGLGAAGGALAGLSGGAIAGAAALSLGSLVIDVAAGDFTFNKFVSSLGSTAKLGAMVGGGAGAVIGFHGGETVFGTLPQLAWEKTGGRFMENQDSINERIEKNAAALAERKANLESETSAHTGEVKTYREQHAEASGSLTKREDQMTTDETQVAEDLNTVDTRIETKAQEDYQKRAATPDSSLDAKGNHGVVGERATLKQWDQKLTNWQGELNTFRSELQSWEQRLDHKIDVEAGAIFGEERKPIDQQFAQMHAKLDAYEKRLDNYEADINNRIQQRYESGIAAEKPGVTSDLRDARREKSDSENQLRNARNEKSDAEQRYNSASRERNRAQGRLQRARQEESNLRSRINQLNRRIRNLESQLRSCRNSL